ncbi:MAG: hypothetical protein JNM27_05820 [Leptospirales bacterium]|nr:hypothetical protein [Leptospirales bacterium]
MHAERTFGGFEMLGSAGYLTGGNIRNTYDKSSIDSLILLTYLRTTDPDRRLVMFYSLGLERDKRINSGGGRLSIVSEPIPFLEVSFSLQGGQPRLRHSIPSYLPTYYFLSIFLNRSDFLTPANSELRPFEIWYITRRPSRKLPAGGALSLDFGLHPGFSHVDPYFRLSIPPIVDVIGGLGGVAIGLRVHAYESISILCEGYGFYYWDEVQSRTSTKYRYTWDKGVRFGIGLNVTD